MVDRKLFARIKTADAGRREILFPTVLKNRQFPYPGTTFLAFCQTLRKFAIYFC
jgi:hypothetical protein